jgi:hypothetical protein
VTWLYVPNLSESSPSSLESAGSMSPSSSPCPELALSVTSSGKPTQRLLSWHGWKTRPWIARLCGTTSAPSTLSRGVERWISSAAASRVRTSPSRETALGSTGSALDSGVSTLGSFAIFDRASSSWRTPQLSLIEGSIGFSGTWPRSGSMRNGRCSERPTSAPPTSARVSSSSPVYPTPSAVMSYGTNRGGAAGRVGPERPSLETWARGWGTPTARDWKGTGREGQLPTQLATWQTPRASDGAKGGPGQALKGKQALSAQAVQARTWPTPCASDTSRSKETPSARNGTHGRHLAATAAEFQPGPPAPTTPTDGPESSAPPPTSPRRVNPRFVEWLMGSVPGWTCACARGTTASMRQETESYPSLRRLRSEFSQIVGGGE